MAQEGNDVLEDRDFFLLTSRQCTISFDATKAEGPEITCIG